MKVPQLPPALVDQIREQIPQVAEITVATVAAQVPAYAPATRDPYRAELEAGVRIAFESFTTLLSDPQDEAVERITRAARSLGRTEARRRRGIGSLLTAYQIGTEVHWREVSGLVLRFGLAAGTVSELAGLIFAFNQQLTAASVEGYTAENQTRERHREILAQALLSGVPTPGQMTRAAWTPPTTLTCVLGSAPQAVAASYPDSLQAPVDDMVAVLVPDAIRPVLLQTVVGTDAVVGPTVPWEQAAHSWQRCTELAHLLTTRPLDTDEHLVELILTGTALADLRDQVLAPLKGNDRLAETLRSWLLHTGRRDAVAADLYVHPQTVRYRMGQIRELYGDRLNDPREVLKLVVALGVYPGDQ